MLNYKKWKALNESEISNPCLGLVQPTVMGFVNDNPIVTAADSNEGKGKSEEKPVEVDDDEDEGDDSEEFSFGSFSTPYFCSCKEPKLKEDGSCCSCKRPTLKECVDTAKAILKCRRNDESPAFQFATIISNQGYLNENLVNEAKKELTSLDQNDNVQLAIKKLNIFCKNISQ